MLILGLLAVIVAGTYLTLGDGPRPGTHLRVVFPCGAIAAAGGAASLACTIGAAVSLQPFDARTGPAPVQSPMLVAALLVSGECSRA